MSAVKTVAKSCAVLLLGRETRPRTILRGLASGYRICISPTEHLGYLLGTDERHLQRAIRKYVNAGDTVYDIGANIGYVSLSLAKRVGAAGRVIAFEPVPANVKALRLNMEINHLANLQLIEAAVSDAPGETFIRIAGNLSMASLVWHRNNPSAEQTSVRTVSIDELTKAGDLPYPAFVKIDVEGAEAAVLTGMGFTIDRARPVLFVECSETGRARAWDLLQGLGYRCQSAITEKSIDSLDEYRHSDFLWLPGNKKKRE